MIIQTDNRDLCLLEDYLMYIIDSNQIGLLEEFIYEEDVMINESVSKFYTKMTNWQHNNPKLNAAMSHAGNIAGAATLFKYANQRALPENKTRIKVLAGTAAIVNAINIQQEYKRIKKENGNVPRTWISRKIQALRKVYRKLHIYLKYQAQTGKANIIKKMMKKVLDGIDWLLLKLQNVSSVK